MKALELRPPSACDASPVQLTFGAETAARIETGSGTACTVAMQAGAAVIEDLTVTAAARHGSVARQRPHQRRLTARRTTIAARQFRLALRGRSEKRQGVAIVRVRVMCSSSL